MTPEAERFNGWAAMLGFVAAVGAYVTTGQIIPGWFQTLKPKNYWLIAEKTNGRLVMIVFMALIINYGLFGWIAPDFF